MIFMWSYFKSGERMSPLKALINLDLLSWSTILVGFEQGWLARKDFFGYAISRIEQSELGGDAFIIGGGESLSDAEIIPLIRKQVKSTRAGVDLDRWRLAFLVSVLSSSGSDDEKLKSLQSIYADFDYPDDMHACSIYSQDDIPPLHAANQVVQQLKNRLLCKE